MHANTMFRSNPREYLAHGLDVLLEGLTPFIEGRFRDVYGPRWYAESERAVDESREWTPGRGLCRMCEHSSKSCTSDRIFSAAHDSTSANVTWPATYCRCATNACTSSPFPSTMHFARSMVSRPCSPASSRHSRMRFGT